MVTAAAGTMFSACLLPLWARSASFWVCFCLFSFSLFFVQDFLEYEVLFLERGHVRGTWAHFVSENAFVLPTQVMAHLGTELKFPNLMSGSFEDVALMPADAYGGCSENLLVPRGRCQGLLFDLANLGTILQEISKYETFKNIHCAQHLDTV